MGSLLSSQFEAMSVTIAHPELDTKSKASNGGGGGPSGHGWDGGGNGWGKPDPPHLGPSPQTYQLAMWLALASVVMLFVALSSAYVVRMGIAERWQPISVPPLLIPNTVLLLASSVTLELARRRLKIGKASSFGMWIYFTTLLGMGFLAGQLLLWQRLRAVGVYLNSSSHSSFFYLMTGTHGLHLVGGVIALLYVCYLNWKKGCSGLAGRNVLNLTAIYWHFMDGLWIYLTLLLFSWRI
ncbi:MAG: heme-copper oxidase subunit III [Acidobacteriota bacterium]